MPSEPLIQISPNIQSAYDAQYTDDMRAWRELGGKYKAQNIVEVCRGIGPINRLLDVGAGEGSVLMYLDQGDFAEQLYALEISHSGINAITQRDLKKLQEVRGFDGYSIPYEDNYFDLAVLSHVLEHVEFPRLLLREIGRVSKYHVIEVPLDFAFDVDVKVKHLMSYGHINVYTPALLRFLLMTEGFEVIQGKGSMIADEIMFFAEFVNQGKPRTWQNIVKLRYRMGRKQLRYHLSRKNHKEMLFDAYTVLCQMTDQSVTIFGA